MKTITAKEFQLKHSSIVKEVAQGHEYEVTFHRRPLIKLVPVSKKSAKNPQPGSHAAVLNSLRYSVQSKGDIHDLPYKELRNRMLSRKHES
jgi:prevent-host-death family protein